MVGQLNRGPSSRRLPVRALVLSGAFVPLLASSATAASPVPLGTAESFAVLAGSTITNTGPTTITGDIGLCCTGLATPGFGSVTQPAGARYVGPGTVAATAQDDLDVAYANAASQAVTNTVPVDLSLAGTAANPLLPGVYESTARGALQINTGLTLDFQGNPNAVFIFRGTTLTTAVGTGGSVNIVNGGAAPSACNIYWQLSDATQGVTLGTASAFKGTTMSLGASVLGTGATVEGRILTRRSNAVTLDTNTITRPICA
ncbi:MAG TPA: ice-binding family protein, partial [Solirubrobacteraceae bacterium]|nr:ice-binding family protein [Solirubrobacteraceae bacterium]